MTATRNAHLKMAIIKMIKRKATRDRQGKVWKGIVAGAAGGLADSLAMNQFQRVWSTASEAIQSNGDKSEIQSEKQSAPTKVKTPPWKLQVSWPAPWDMSFPTRRNKKRDPCCITHLAPACALYGAGMELASRKVRREPACLPGQMK